jgi:hypothetical protein
LDLVLHIRLGLCVQPDDVLDNRPGWRRALVERAANIR